MNVPWHLLMLLSNFICELPLAWNYDMKRMSSSSKSQSGNGKKHDHCGLCSDKSWSFHFWYTAHKLDCSCQQMQRCCCARDSEHNPQGLDAFCLLASCLSACLYRSVSLILRNMWLWKFLFWDRRLEQQALLRLIYPEDVGSRFFWNSFTLKMEATGSSETLLPWRWRQQVPAGRCYLSNRLHGVTSQNTLIFTFTFVWT
jgi:hypothetical protein